MVKFLMENCLLSCLKITLIMLICKANYINIMYLQKP